ncbi:MAG: formate dehydrogenase accessory protein FdhE [Candidatus Methylomirabilales bacterium]
MLKDYPWEEIASYLQALRERRTPLAELLDFYEKVLYEVYRSGASPQTSALVGPHLEGRNRKGQTVVERSAFVIDLPKAEALFWRLAEVIKARGGEVGERIGLIEEAVKYGSLALARLLQGAVVEEGYVGGIAEEHNLDPELLAFLVSLSIRPSVEACAKALISFADLNAWYKRVCPLCGSPPKMAELKGEQWTSFRWLYCAFCGMSWPSRRLGCPFCGNQDHQQLNLLYAEEDRRCRIETCGACRRYIKVVDNKEFFGLIPFLEDLATPHLDLLALERGFH